MGLIGAYGPIWAYIGAKWALGGLRAHMSPYEALWAPMGGSYGHIRGEAPLSQPGPLRALRPLRALGGPSEGPIWALGLAHMRGEAPLRGLYTAQEGPARPQKGPARPSQG